MPSADDYSFDIKAIRSSELFTIIISSISSLFPASVVFILIKNWDTLVRGKTFVHYILMISIADTISNIFMAWGFPNGGSLECSIQGFIRFFFSRMSWFYTDVLILQLVYVLLVKPVFFKKKYIHCIIWTLNILLQILPFTTKARYGGDDQVDYEICSIYPGKGSSRVAYSMAQYTFSVELMISYFIITFATLTLIYYRVFKTTIFYNLHLIRDTWSTIVWFSIAMMISWVPSTAYAFYFNQSLKNNIVPYHGIVILNCLNVFQSLYGPLLSIIFYANTEDAVKAWLSIIYPTKIVILENNIILNSLHDDNDSFSNQSGEKVNRINF